MLILRYEDMLAAPERCFGRLASFLRLRPSAQQLRRAIEKSSFAELARQEAAQGFVERPEKAEKFFRSGMAGQLERGFVSGSGQNHHRGACADDDAVWVCAGELRWLSAAFAVPVHAIPESSVRHQLCDWYRVI
ncbi:MAG: sulfotransferase domain-containing protein [Rhodoblastus sp.]|uniref:sulfotransferase domain-containing protein n=1 Tax=Rhodoblastus sp. TaxID=1962975 RepID=UPI003F9716F5